MDTFHCVETQSHSAVFQQDHNCHSESEAFAAGSFHCFLIRCHLNLQTLLKLFPDSTSNSDKHLSGGFLRIYMKTVPLNNHFT